MPTVTMHGNSYVRSCELEMSKRNEAASSFEDWKSDIGWGSQIRSYVWMTHVLKIYVLVLKTRTQVQY